MDNWLACAKARVLFVNKSDNGATVLGCHMAPKRPGDDLVQVGGLFDVVVYPDAFTHREFKPNDMLTITVSAVRTDVAP